MYNLYRHISPRRDDVNILTFIVFYLKKPLYDNFSNNLLYVNESMHTELLNCLDEVNGGDIEDFETRHLNERKVVKWIGHLELTIGGRVHLLSWLLVFVVVVWNFWKVDLEMILMMSWDINCRELVFSTLLLLLLLLESQHSKQRRSFPICFKLRMNSPSMVVAMTKKMRTSIVLRNYTFILIKNSYS